MCMHYFVRLKQFVNLCWRQTAYCWIRNIFIARKRNFNFCYFPRCECGIESKRFHRLTEYFVSEVNYREKEGVHFAYSIHKASMEENYSIERIMNELVEAVQEEKKEERMIPAVNYEERIGRTGNTGDSEKKDFWEPVKRLLDKRKKENGDIGTKSILNRMTCNSGTNFL
mgnify:CR=1 FL=1